MSGPRTRITGGTLRGRPLRVVAGVRPTEARVREAVFSIWRGALAGSRFVDLFAGSGAVGLEALSRGAREVTFVEGDARVLAALRESLERFGKTGARLLRGSLPELALRRPAAALGVAGVDLVYADPPYDFARYVELVGAVVPWLAQGGELCVEHAVGVELPETLDGAERLDTRVYGGTRLSFYRSSRMLEAVPAS